MSGGFNVPCKFWRHRDGELQPANTVTATVVNSTGAAATPPQAVPAFHDLAEDVAAPWRDRRAGST